MAKENKRPLEEIFSAGKRGTEHRPERPLKEIFARQQGRESPTTKTETLSPADSVFWTPSDAWTTPELDLAPGRTPNFHGKKKLAFLEQSQHMMDGWQDGQEVEATPEQTVPVPVFAGLPRTGAVPVPVEKAVTRMSMERFAAGGLLNPGAVRSGVLLDPESERTPAAGDMVLPSGTVLRKSDQDLDAFFQEQVAPGIDTVQAEVDERAHKTLVGQGEARDRRWLEHFNIDPVGDYVADAVQTAATSRRERGPVRVVEEAMAGIDPAKVNAYIADHLADDPEFVAATDRLKKAIPVAGEVSDEKVEQLQAALSPAQRKQYDKAVVEEQKRIAGEQQAFQKAADAVWKRQAQQFQQGITGRLVEDMARRNMPESELDAFARIALNTSIPGMLTEWTVTNATGGDKALHAQIMQRALEKYDPSIWTRIGGDVAGLLLSTPVFSVGGALGKAGAAGLRRMAERSVMKRLMARGITEGAEGTARRLVAGNAAQRLAQGAVASGATLSTYDALATPLAMAAAGENPSFWDVLGAASRGFATGALLPGIGMATGRAADAAGSRLGRYAAELGGFAAENAAFVGMGTLYNGIRTGEWGTPEQLAGDFAHSVGVLGIMKSIGVLKRGRTKNPDFYDKVITETEFTPEEVDALDRIGVDGRSYKRAVFDLLNAKETALGREGAEGAAEQLGSRYADVMRSPDVPVSAKAKLMYLVEGRIPERLPLTTDIRRTVDKDGRTTVDLLDPVGNLVQRRTFSSEKAAEAFERKSAGVREVNSIQYYESLIDWLQPLDDIVWDISTERGINAGIVKTEILKATQRQPYDTELVQEVFKRADRNHITDMDIPGVIVGEIVRKYHLEEGGLEQALSKREKVRTPEERAAVGEYAVRLKEVATQLLRSEPMPERRAERQLSEVAEQAIEQVKNRDDGVVYTATMQDGKQVNIIKGASLVYDPETGEVDAAQSDPTVVVRYDDGTMRQVSVREIDMIVEKVAADDARAEALKTIREQLDAAAREEALADTAGSGGMVELKDGRIGVVEGVNEDGSYSVALQDSEGRIITEQVTAGDIAGPVAEEQEAEAPASEDPLLGHSLTAEESAQVIEQMQAAVIPAPQLELTPKNWDAEFGPEGKVQTPLGEVKMGDHQFLKMMREGRGNKFGMIKPTLTDPYMVVEDQSRANEGQRTERPSTYVFVKPFVNEDGDRKYLFTSVTVQRDGQEVVISNQEKEIRRIERLLKEGRLTYIKKATLPSEAVSSAQGGQSAIPHGDTPGNESLSGSEGRLTEPHAEGPDLVPTPNDSENKDTTTIPQTQVSEPEIPRLKNGQPDFNAMPADILAVELSEAVGHDKAVERLQVARGANVKNMEKLRKALDGMGDLNKAMAMEQRLGVMQQEDARLAEALERLGAIEVQDTETAPARTFSQEIERLFPEGLPNVRARVLADIARGQRFVWNDSPDGVKRGVATELGFAGNESERRGRFGMLGSEATGAKHVSSYVHDLWEDSNGYAFDMDDAALRDEVIDVLLTTPSRTAAMEQLRDMAVRTTENTAAPQDAEDQAAQQAYEETRKSLLRNGNNTTFADGGTRPEKDGTAAEKSEPDNDEPTVAPRNDGGGLAKNSAGAILGTGDRGDIRVFEKGLASEYHGDSGDSERDRRETESERLVNGERYGAEAEIRKNNDGNRTADHGGIFSRHGDESGRNNDERRQTDGRRLSVNPTGVDLAASDRGDIRVFEEGLGTSYNEHSEYSERDRRETESERLVTVAKETGRYINPKEWGLFGQKYAKRTGESVVYINEAAGKVYKIKNPYAKAAIRGGVPEDAIYNHVIHDLLFPETRYAFEGISEHLGDVRIVLSQDFVESAGMPTQQQISSALAGRGLFPEDKYTYGNSLVSVTDVEGDNVLLGYDGQLYFIDPIIKLKRPAQEVIEAYDRARNDAPAAPDIVEQPGADDVPFSVIGKATPAPADVTHGRWTVIVDQLRRVIGAENVVTDPAAVRAAYDRIMGRGMEIRQQQVAEVNERFNEQLGQLTPENANSSILDLGMPSPEMLSVGVVDRPLRLYGNKLLAKAEKHGYDLLTVRDLPQAMEHPIAIFQGRRNGSFTILTQINIGDKNAVVAVNTTKYGIGDINFVSSVYGKRSAGIIDWINDGKLLYADKENTLNYIGASSPLADAQYNQGFVTATNIVTNFENPKIEPENVRRSIVEDKTLVGVHNLTEDNILHAERMGGLANPSMAVIDIAQGGKYDNFGDITLVAPRTLIDKSSGKNIGTYGADIYTPRYPQIERQYGEKLQQFAGEIEDFVKTHFDSDTPIAKRYARSKVYLDPTNAPSGESALKRESYMQAYYAEEALGKPIPKNATEEQINRMVPNPSDFYQWMNDTFSGLAEREVIPAGSTPTGRQRYLDHTLENVSRFMKAQGRAGSEGYNYGLGSLHSHFVPRFTTLKQIRCAKNRLQTPEEFQQTKIAFQKEYDALRNELEKVDANPQDRRDADVILSDALLSKEVREYLKQQHYQPSDELLIRMENFRAALAYMPAEYFETKFERPVRLNEFAGAIVPNDTAPEAIAALKNSGIETIEQYDPAVTGSREKALRVLADNLDQADGVYFMKTPEGEVYGFTTGGKIYLDSSLMNAATPMHEYTELWSQIVARENPEWWSRAKEILQSDEGRLGEIWKTVNADPNYRGLSEEMRASETISRASAELFEREQAGMHDNEGLFASLRRLVREFWEKVKSALSGKWSTKELHDMTAEEVMRAPVKDFVEGIDLQKYATEVGNTPRFARDFTERRVTTLEKLENKRAALIAEKENIPNFDEQKQTEWQTRYNNLVIEAATELAAAYAPETELLCIRSGDDIESYRKLGQIISGTNVSEDEVPQIKAEVDAMLAAGNRAFAWQNTIILPSLAYRTLPIQTITGDIIHESVHTRINRNVSAEILKAIYNEALPTSHLLAKINTHPEYAHLTPERKAGELLAYAISRQVEIADSSLWRYINNEASLNEVSAILAQNMGDSPTGIRVASELVENIRKDYDRFRDIQRTDEERSIRESGRDNHSIGNRNLENRRQGDRNPHARDNVHEDVLRDIGADGGESRADMERGARSDSVRKLVDKVNDLTDSEAPELPKQQQLIADRENIANFDEQLAAVDDEIEAYRRVDHVAETYGQNGENAESDAHLKSVEDAVCDIIRKEGVKDVQVDVVQSADALLEYARKNNWEKNKISQIEQSILSPGYYDNQCVTILSSQIENKKAVTGVFWHERTHGITDITSTPKRLAQAANQAGTVVLNRALERRNYSTENCSMERIADEYVSRAVEILAKKGLLGDYLATAKSNITPIEQYLTERNVPEELHSIIIDNCKYIKEQKYGREATILLRADDHSRDSASGKPATSMQSDNRTAVETDQRATERGNIPLRRGFSGTERRSAADDNEGGVRTDDTVGIHTSRGRDLEEDSSSKLSKQQQLIADLRRAVRESQASAKGTAILVSRRVREYLSDADIDDVSRHSVNLLTKAIGRAVTMPGVELRLREIDSILTDEVIKDRKKQFDRLISLKIQGKDGRGRSIAANVDDEARASLEILRDNLNRPYETVKKVVEQAQQDGNNSPLAAWDGLNMLELYEDVENSMADLKSMRANRKKLQEETVQLYHKIYDGEKLTDGENREDLFSQRASKLAERRALIESDLELRQHIATQWGELIEELHSRISTGRSALQEKRKQQKAYKSEFIHNALQDVWVGPVETYSNHKMDEPRKYNVFIDHYKSMRFMVNYISRNAYRGEGFLNDNLIEGPNGWVKCRMTEIEFSDEDIRALDGLCQKNKIKNVSALERVFNELLSDDKGDPIIYSCPGSATKARQEIALSIGNGTYTILCARQADLLPTLYHQGFTPELLGGIEHALPDYALKFIDFATDYLSKVRSIRYNPAHILRFGTQLANNKNYFTAVRLDSEVYKSESTNDITSGKGIMPSVGSLVKRRHSVVPLDITQNPVRLFVSHLKEMNNFAAFAPYAENIDILISSKAFREQLNKQHRGNFNHFMNAARVSLNTHIPASGGLDRVVVEIQGMAASSKIAFGFFTALKQPLSIPAFCAYSWSPVYQARLAKNILAWSKTEEGIERNFKWCYRNMPLFRERWDSRFAGDERLKYVGDSGTAKMLYEKAPMVHKTFATIGNYGMWTNAHFDIYACGIGARSIYEFEFDRAQKEEGMTKTEAHEFAIIQAQIAFNESQQSSESLFLSPAQLDRTLLHASASLFENSNKGYGRKEKLGRETLSSFLDKERRRRMFDNAVKRYTSRGLTEEEAKKRAKRDRNRAARHAVSDVIMFKYVLNMLWRVAPNVVAGLITMGLTGDDDEVKRAIKSAISPKELLAATFRNAAGGSTFNSLLDGFYNPGSMLEGDIAKLMEPITDVASGKKEWGEIVDNDLFMDILSFVSSNTAGVDIKKFTNFYNAAVALKYDGSWYPGIAAAKFFNTPKDIINATVLPPREGETQSEYLLRIAYMKSRAEANVSGRELKKWERVYKAYGQAKVLGMHAVRDWNGNVTIPELKQLNDAYAEALKRAGLTKSGELSDDLKKELQALSPEKIAKLADMRKSIYAIYLLERDAEKSIVFNDAWKKQAEEMIEHKRNFIQSWNNK